MKGFADRFRSAAIAAAVVIGAVVVLLFAPSTGHPARSRPQERIYNHRELGFEEVFSIVCEAAYETVLDLEAKEIRSSLNRVTGRPESGFGSDRMLRQESIRATLSRVESLGSVELDVAIAASTMPQASWTTNESESAVAVRLMLRIDPSLDDDEDAARDAKELQNLFFKRLDRAVRRKLRDAGRGLRSGMTPTPWAGLIETQPPPGRPPSGPYYGRTPTPWP